MFVKMLRLLLFKLTETLCLKYMQLKQAYVWSAVHATTLYKQKAKDSDKRSRSLQIFETLSGGFSVAFLFVRFPSGSSSNSLLVY